VRPWLDTSGFVGAMTAIVAACALATAGLYLWLWSGM
jgi:hypothetical protein